METYYRYSIPRTFKIIITGLMLPLQINLICRGEDWGWNIASASCVEMNDLIDGYDCILAI